MDKRPKLTEYKITERLPFYWNCSLVGSIGTRLMTNVMRTFIWDEWGTCIVTYVVTALTDINCIQSDRIACVRQYQFSIFPIHERFIFLSHRDLIAMRKTIRFFNVRTNSMLRCRQFFFHYDI